MGFEKDLLGFKTNMTTLANDIREKTGITDKLNLAEMTTEVLSMEVVSTETCNVTLTVTSGVSSSYPVYLYYIKPPNDPKCAKLITAKTVSFECLKSSGVVLCNYVTASYDYDIEVTNGTAVDIPYSYPDIDTNFGTIRIDIDDDATEADITIGVSQGHGGGSFD